MGLERFDLRKFADLAKLTDLGKKPGQAMAVLGDCTFHFDNEALFEALGRPLEGLYPQNAVATLKSFRDALGLAHADTLDCSGNPTIRMDITAALDASLEQKYDWVLDAGTIFCCWDVAAALRNTLLMLKPGGYALHIAGMTGHYGRCAYYNIHPALFYDFYTQNGAEVLYLGTRVKPRFVMHGGRRPLRSRLNSIEWEPIELGPNYFLRSSNKYSIGFSHEHIVPEPDLIPNNVMILCFARKKEHVKPRGVAPAPYADAWKKWQDSLPQGKT